MGVISFAIPWTFIYSLIVHVLSAERSLFDDLGLNTVPDVAKINISQEEYTTMMGAYLDGLRRTTVNVPELITFTLERDGEMTPSGGGARLRFRIGHDRQLDVESGQLRLLAPPLATASTVVDVRIYQIMGARRRRLIDTRQLYPSSSSPKWCDFDVTEALRGWLAGDRNLGVEIVCDGCGEPLLPQAAALSALILPSASNRRRTRAAPIYQPSRRTDCRETRDGGGRRKCCRHNMTVTFKDLRFPEMASIIQPKSYEAGFCQGQCPPNYNHATNHSRIQSLMHQMDKKTARRENRRPIPKACCAPSKLEPLEILRVNPNDATKLIVEKWDNMQVVECACS